MTAAQFSGPASARVGLVGAGGTIACVGRGPLDLCEYGLYGQILRADELLRAVPEAGEIAQVTPIPFRNVISEAIGPSDWLALRALLEQAAAAGQFDGIVIAHGTSSLEETAYFLDLTLTLKIPVILVGAQRPLSGLSSDARLNLVNAIRVAAASDARDMGVLTLLNDEIQAARESTKTSNYRLHAFRSGALGPLGFVDPDGTVALLRRPARSRPDIVRFPLAGVDVLPRVDIVQAYAGADGAALDAFVTAGARGIVVAGFLPGSATPEQMRAVAAARRREVAIAFSTRSDGGRVVRRANLCELGAIAAADLTPQKARILLMLALLRTDDPDELQEMFDAS